MAKESVKELTFSTGKFNVLFSGAFGPLCRELNDHGYSCGMLNFITEDINNMMKFLRMEIKPSTRDSLFQNLPRPWLDNQSYTT